MELCSPIRRSLDLSEAVLVSSTGVQSSSGKDLLNLRTSFRRTGHSEDQSTVRIERFARLLAPSQPAAKAAAISRLLVSDREARAEAGYPTVASDSSKASTRAQTGQSQGEMMKHLCEVGDFVRRLRIQTRFGELSRARLSLLRVQLCGDYAECDWIARPPDRWDADLPPVVGKRNASIQALQDAIKIPALLFRALPGVQKAELRGYRYSSDDSLELILSGSVNREVRVPTSVRSLAMRAKLFGFRFWMKEGILESLSCEEYAMNF